MAPTSTPTGTSLPSKTPSSTTTHTPSATSSSTSNISRMPVGTRVGIALTVLILFSLFLATLFLLHRRNKLKKAASAQRRPRISRPLELESADKDQYSGHRHGSLETLPTEPAPAYGTHVHDLEYPRQLTAASVYAPPHTNTPPPPFVTTQAPGKSFMDFK